MSYSFQKLNFFSLTFQLREQSRLQHLGSLTGLVDVGLGYVPTVDDDVIRVYHRQKAAERYVDVFAAFSRTKSYSRCLGDGAEPV